MVQPSAPDGNSPKKVSGKAQPAEPSGPLYLPLNLDYSGLKKVHQHPPIYGCDNFLTNEECKAFITTAGPLLQRSKTHAIAGTARRSCLILCIAGTAAHPLHAVAC